MSAFYLFRGGGAPKADIVCFFYRFYYMMASLIGKLNDEDNDKDHVIDNYENKQT